MSEAISEQRARELLLEAHSAAHNASRYVAERLLHGWVFAWSGDLRSAPLGTRPWVVSDNGAVRAVEIGQTAAEVLAQLERER